MKNYPFDKGKETWKELEKVCRFGYDTSYVFADFLDIVLSGLLSFTDNMKHADIIERIQENKLEGVYEQQYLKLVKKYKENQTKERGDRPIDYFHTAWRALQKETMALEHDILGELFMTQISHGQHGQFFTPAHLTDMIGKMVGEYKEGDTVNDPACGSGRFFISISKQQKNLKFVGNDISMNCVKMTVLNMWMFNLHADIYLGDTLTNKMDQVWMIRPGGYVWEKEL